MGATAEVYEENLKENIGELENRMKSGRYRVPSVRRVYIPKSKIEKRPIVIPTFEDKVSQKAVQMILEPLYEQDFYDLSYGFHPGKLMNIYKTTA